MSKIINLTPHTVTILDNDNNVMTAFPSSGNARCSQTTQKSGEIEVNHLYHKDGPLEITFPAVIPITSTCFGEVVDLPSPSADTYYIVSRIVMTAWPDRKDLLVPNELVRDGEGRIIGCKSLASN